ncbi:hypothetical protein EON64_09525 [archaeon]|nr:MAG: hypothetical protein EON64_09525 [archaeon]
MRSKCSEVISHLVESFTAYYHDKGYPHHELHDARTKELVKILSILHQHQVAISCEPCSSSGVEGKARAFLQTSPYLQITLCENRLRSERAVKEALLHESIHAYDSLHHIDLTTPQGLVYSEVRANREAECGDSLKLFNTYCTKKKAHQAANNILNDSALTQQCLDQVFEQAMQDRRPWSDS